MNKIKQILALMLAFVLPMVLAATPVYARDGADNASESSEVEKTPETETHIIADFTEKVRDSAKEKSDHAHSEVRKQNEDNKDSTVKSPEKLQKKCEDQKNGLTQKVANINKNAQKHFDRISSVYEKILKYQSDNKVAVANISELTAAADAAKIQAQASLDTLKALTPTLDCTQGTVPNDIATFRASVAQARIDLRAYRSSVKDILKVVKDTKEKGASQ